MASYYKKTKFKTLKRLVQIHKIFPYFSNVLQSSQIFTRVKKQFKLFKDMINVLKLNLNAS